MQFLYRPGKASDMPFMADCIRKGLQQSPYGNGISNDVLSKLIDPVLGSYRSLVAYPDGDVDGIVGFIVHDGPKGDFGSFADTVAWLQVRKEFRRNGIARELLYQANCIRGNVICPFLVQKWDGGSNFSRACGDYGYRLRFRPWLPLEITEQVQS
jgi:GNAT superfamily N-acetyltransferase